MKFLVCSRLSEHRYKTPEGYLVCVDSILSRTGKQTYSRDELFKDGCTDEVEVERSAEEVFSEKTLASFENKPLTIEHPEEDVTPANHNKYSVGFIRDVKRGKDGSEDVMLGTIVVTDAEAIELIETGKLKELSCGYDCDIEDEDNPQQRNIRGNHVALCEKGRAGIARIVDSVMGLIKDANFEICYIDDGDVCVLIEAKDENDARQKFRRRYGMYYIKHIRKVKDGVKDMKVSHDNIREQPVFVMQSDVDKNLFFYIGKTHAMKEGEWTYAQYDMEGMTPDELRKELEANGWHKVAKGPAPFIDEDPYEESTEGLEEAEKNLHDEMICNTETDCEDADESIVYKGIKIDVHKGLYGQSIIVHAPNGSFKYSSIETAKRDIDKKDKELFDSVKDAKTEYVFNYRDTYHGTRDKMRVDANNLDEAIRKFGDTIALGGFGTANIYVVSVSPNDGYMRAYGKLSEMLKQKWTKDSVKDSTYKVEYISSGAEMYPIVEVDAASESEAIETVRKKDKKFVRLISVKKQNSVKKHDSKKSERQEIIIMDAKKARSIITVVKRVSDISNRDRLAPSQYKALRELGYNESKWKNMTSEEASRIIAAAKQKKEKTQSKEETSTKKQTKSLSLSSGEKISKEDKDTLLSMAKEFVPEIDDNPFTDYDGQINITSPYMTAGKAKKLAAAIEELGYGAVARNRQVQIEKSKKKPPKNTPKPSIDKLSLSAGKDISKEEEQLLAYTLESAGLDSYVINDEDNKITFYALGIKAKEAKDALSKLNPNVSLKSGPYGDVIFMYK